MKTKIIFILALLALISSVQASSIESYKIITEVIDENTVNENIVITLANNIDHDIDSATIYLPKESAITSIRDTYGPLKYDVSKSDNIAVNLYFKKPLSSNSKRTLMIEIETKELVTYKGDYFEYLLVFTPKDNISDFEHLLKLPQDAKLYSSESDLRIIYPEAVQDKNYDTLAYIWHLDLKEREPQVFLVRFRLPYTDWLSMAILTAEIIMALIIVATLFLYISGNYSKQKLLDSVKLLSENEKNIVSFIIKNEGISQHKLQDELGYKKSAISKIITRLEIREIITRKKYGKTNRLYLGRRAKK
ncbi:MAG: MarR family transcriptional regulator [archaeon]